MSNADSDAAMSLINDIRPMLAGHAPQVQGAVLADLLATWLAGHSASTSKASDALRNELLAMHVHTVRMLIPVNVAAIRAAKDT